MARAPKTFRARFELPRELEMYVDPSDEGADSPDSEPMTEEALGSLVDGQINDARLYESSDLIRQREKALKYYDGEVADIVPAPGRSQVVSRDLSDTHGLIMPGLMRVFLSTDNIAIYKPASPDDEPFARQATDYVNYVVMQECQGYIQFRSAFHNGLLLGNGPIKHWWDDTPVYSTENFTGLSDDAYTMLALDPDVEVLEHSEYDDPDFVPPPPMPMMPSQPSTDMLTPPMQPSTDMLTGPGEMPEPQAPKLHDCKLKRMTSKGRLRVLAIAPEDLLIGRGVLALDEEHVRFVAHRWIKTRSALIKEGFDEDDVNELPAYVGANLDTPEALARDRHHLFGGDVAPDKTVELIEGYECYIQCDYDGDGVAEWRKVTAAGTTGKRAILENVEWGDDLPFSDIVPDPVPHRWRGRSLFDLVEDVQRIKTVVMRQTLDNIYMTNTPRQYVLENQVVNPEVLQDWEIGSTVIERAPNSVRYDDMPFVADKSFALMEYLDQMVEKRTGVSRSTVALDLDALQDQTATAVNAQQAAAHTKVEEYARNIAEHGGLQRVFSKILKLIVKHQDRARTVRLREHWVEVDPRAWNANMDVIINTGLGSGSRERDLSMLMGVAAKQEAVVMQLGPANPVLGIDTLFDTYRLMAEAAGLKPADRFFREISPQIMQQLQQAASQKVDPKVQAAQMQAQTDAQKMQLQAQMDDRAAQQKAALDQQSQQFEQQTKQLEVQRDAQMQQLQFEREAQVEERQAQADIAVRRAEAESKARLAAMQFDFDQRMAVMKFEFDKQLKLIDAQTKRTAIESQAGVDAAAQAEKSAPGQAAMKQFADSHAQLAAAMGQFGQQLAQGQKEHGQALASALGALAKPKRQRVVRDENNRIVGAEEIH